MNLLTIILGFLPGFTWLLFYLKEDSHPEPKKIVAMVFLAGAISAIAALGIELFANCAISYNFNGCGSKIAEEVRLTPLLVLIFAAIEEMAKFGAVYFTVARTKYFAEPVDVMVYMAVAALGFATVENLAAFLQSTQATQFFSNDFFETITFRFVGTTLLHALTASVLGYFWAMGIRSFKSGKFIVYGLIFAAILHTIFNYLILIYSNLLYAIVFVTIVGFFTFSDFDKLKGRKI